MLLLSSADFFSKLTFSKNSSWSAIRVSNGLDSDQDGRFVGPDLGQSVCKGYQQTTKVAANKERVNNPCQAHISRAEGKTIVTDIFMKSIFWHIFVPFCEVHVPSNFH